MHGRFLTTAAVAVLSLAAAGNVALAQEFQRLTYTPDQPIPASGISAGVATMTLQIDENTEDAENVLTWGRRGWGGYGYRGYGWGGGYRGYGWGGGYRGWGYSAYRGWGGYGWGGGYRGWGGYGWGGYGYRSYYQPYYSYYGSYVPYYNYYYPRTYYYGPSCYYYPISTDVDAISAPNYTQAIVKVEPTRVHGQPNGGVAQVVPPAGQQNGSFYYDGGPQSPVPLPRSGVETKPLPAAPPQKKVPLEGMPVSLPANSPAKFAYPAYGEKPVQTNFAEDRVIAVKK
jgi:hypothetical protein